MQTVLTADEMAKLLRATRAPVPAASACAIVAWAVNHGGLESICQHRATTLESIDSARAFAHVKQMAALIESQEAQAAACDAVLMFFQPRGK